MIVTVTRKGKRRSDAISDARYVLAVDKLPGRTFGPFDYSEMSRELAVLTTLHPSEVRDLLLRAATEGTAQGQA